MIGRSLTPFNSSRTTREVARRDENSRKKVRNVVQDSSARPPGCPLQDVQLMPQREDFKVQRSAGATGVSEREQDRDVRAWRPIPPSRTTSTQSRTTEFLVGTSAICPKRRMAPVWRPLFVCFRKQLFPPGRPAALADLPVRGKRRGLRSGVLRRGLCRRRSRFFLRRHFQYLT
jgi:hypothetical protein